MIMNEKIRASEVALTGLNGEDLGIIGREEALAIAKRAKADMVCISLTSSPPPCRLMARGAAKNEVQQMKRTERRQEKPAKAKEIRLTAFIEEHDYDTKCRQAEKLLESGHTIELVIRLQGKEGEKARSLLEKICKDLSHAGTKATGIQMSGKQAKVELNPSN
ncbi:translation initiation factor IF-3 [Paenibacillus tarimensis]